MTLEISPHSSYFDDSTVIQPLFLTIEMITSGPEFEQTPVANDIHCDLEDNGWEMKVPGIKF